MVSARWRCPGGRWNVRADVHTWWDPGKSSCLSVRPLLEGPVGVYVCICVCICKGHTHSRPARGPGPRSDLTSSWLVSQDGCKMSMGCQESSKHSRGRGWDWARPKERAGTMSCHERRVIHTCRDKKDTDVIAYHGQDATHGFRFCVE